MKAKRGRFSIRDRDRVSWNESPQGAVENTIETSRRDPVSRDVCARSDFHRGARRGENFETKNFGWRGAWVPTSGWKSGFPKEGRRFARLSTGERSYHVQPRRHVVRMCSACVLLSRKKKRKKRKRGKKKRSLAKSRGKNRKRQQVVAWTVAPFRFTHGFVDGPTSFLNRRNCPDRRGSIVDDEEEEEPKKKKKKQKEDNGKTNSPPKFAQSLGQLRVVKLRILIGEYSPRGLSPHHKRVHRSLHVGCSFVTGTPAIFGR